MKFELAERQPEVAESRETNGHDKALLQVAVAEALDCLNAGKTAKARALLDEVHELSARSDAASYLCGLFYLNTGDWKLALQWFERALTLRPTFVEARTGCAVALQKLGRPLEALAAFKAILRA